MKEIDINAIASQKANEVVNTIKSGIDNSAKIIESIAELKATIVKLNNEYNANYKRLLDLIEHQSNEIEVLKQIIKAVPTTNNVQKQNTVNKNTGIDAWREKLIEEIDWNVSDEYESEFKSVIGEIFPEFSIAGYRNKDILHSHIADILKTMDTKIADRIIARKNRIKFTDQIWSYYLKSWPKANVNSSKPLTSQDWANVLVIDINVLNKYVEAMRGLDKTHIGEGGMMNKALETHIGTVAFGKNITGHNMYRPFLAWLSNIANVAIRNRQ